MIESYLRPQYEKVLLEPAIKLVPDSLDNNMLSVWAGVIGVLVLPALYAKFHLLAILLLLASGYLVTLVTKRAKKRHEDNKVSTLLNTTINHVVEIAVIIGLFAVHPVGRGWLALVMLASLLLYYTSFAATQAANKNKQYSPPLMDRAEIFILFVLMIIAPEFFWLFALVFIALTLYTMYIRVQEFKGHFEQAN